MESMTWACSLRETATPVPCQATQHQTQQSTQHRTLGQTGQYRTRVFPL